MLTIYSHFNIQIKCAWRIYYKFDFGLADSLVPKS